MAVATVAQAEARDRSITGSDFLPVTFQFPVAVCILRVGADFGLQALTCLDAPLFRPRKITEAFWAGLSSYKEKYRERVKLVTFNGRCFDMPLLEQAAFRYGCNCGRDYFQSSRNRFGGGHIDLGLLRSGFRRDRCPAVLESYSRPALFKRDRTVERRRRTKWRGGIQQGGVLFWKGGRGGNGGRKIERRN